MVTLMKKCYQKCWRELVVIELVCQWHKSKSGYLKKKTPGFLLVRKHKSESKTPIRNFVTHLIKYRKTLNSNNNHLRSNRPSLIIAVISFYSYAHPKNASQPLFSKILQQQRGFLHNNLCRKQLNDHKIPLPVRAPPYNGPHRAVELEIGNK